ncbi:MAG TPA: carboxypeptidase-like regulatory domain-containing protein [Candidatus Eremiobacteraeota bacterium]|nr:MAG: hypothetical protein BWY64_03084 [bacterium ADurb.Bin363]HPZ09740.1 carboxypeptidase-like regulatory domain-containing protein [Candidatus Eremiobacteraeota bacterium]
MKQSSNLNIILSFAILLILITPFIIYGCGDSNDPDIGSVQGQIFDLNGQIMPGVQVEINGINVYGVSIQDTNIEGRYSFVNIPVGEYLLTVTKQDNTFIASKNATVKKNETQTVDIQEGEVAPPTPTPVDTPTPDGTLTPIDLLTPTPTPPPG